MNMLKINPICEHNELHVDICRYNLEETVQMRRAESGDDISAFADDDGISGMNIFAIGATNGDGAGESNKVSS